MSFPVTTSQLINDSDFNAIQTIVDNVLGLGENGWGLALYSSNPVSTTDKVRAFDMNNLIRDVGIIHTHITNVNTNTSYVVTGTTLVNTVTFNQLKTTGDYYSSDLRRYTCHPDQFVRSNTLTDDIVFLASGLNGSTSTRSIIWGETTETSVRVISHRLVASWPTRLQARYYFNQGSFVAWRPYHLGDGLNDLDTEWANFIDWLNAPQNEYRYTRNEFVNYEGALGTSTYYTSGTLQVTVQAIKATDEKSVEFNIELTNLDTADLIVTPAVAYYNILL